MTENRQRQGICFHSLVENSDIHQILIWDVKLIITSVKRRGGQYDENVQFNYTKGNACAKIAEEVMKG